MKVSLKYRQIAKRLSMVQLQKTDPDNSLINETDLFYKNVAGRGHNFFLGYYSEEGIKLALEKYGIFKLLAGKGFKDVCLKIDTSDAYLHRLSLFERKEKQENLLAEIVIKMEIFKVNMPFETPLNDNHYKTISIEWMRLQNPRMTFTKKRPQLPGQQFPGLGMATHIVELLIIAAWRLKMTGLMNSPDHYHNAFLYSRAFCYENPLHEAKLVALSRDLKKYPLDMIAWAMDWNAVIEQNSNKIEKWFAAKQIIPLDKDLKELFAGKKYAEIVKQKAKEFKYILDEQKYNQMKQRSLNED